MANKPLTIWFDDKGNLLENCHKWGRINWKSEEAKDFTDRMQYIKLYDFRRKGARVYLKSVLTGREYSMHVEDFNEVILANLFVNNQIEGTWRFIKHGTGQAIKLLIPQQTQNTPTP